MRITQTTDVDLLTHLNQHIHELHASLYPEYFVEYNIKAIRASFKQRMTDENLVFLVLEDIGEPLGYACIEIKEYPETAQTKARHSVFVHDISIVEGQERRGYGSHLMNHIYDKQGFVSYRQMVYKRL